MAEFITMIGLGILVSILGIINMSGNISTIHWYHRKRVSEENVKPFGKLVGAGTFIIGIAFVIFGILQFISVQMKLDVLLIIGTVEIIAGVVVGLGLSFYAMIKYNKGIF